MTLYRHNFKSMILTNLPLRFTLAFFSTIYQISKLTPI